MPDAHMTASEARRLVMKVIAELSELACMLETLEGRVFERDETITQQAQTIEVLQRKIIDQSKGKTT